jgi:hypothetical protein
MISAPIVHGYTSRLYPKLDVLGARSSLVGKLVLDGLVITPLTMGIYFFTCAVLQGQSNATALDRIRTKTYPAVIDSWKLWPFVNVITYSYVPIHLQVLFINIVGIFWTGYLSYV